MANKKTTHKKSYSKIHPQAYQFGGLSFLEPFSNLNKQWNSFWRGGDYFNNNGLINQTLTKSKYVGKDTNEIYNNSASPFYNPDYQKYQGFLRDKTQVEAYEKAWKDHQQGLNPSFDDREWEGISETYQRMQDSGIDPNYSYNDFDKSFKPITAKNVLTDHTAGLFSGLNYINSYVPPEKINLQQGYKGVMYQKGGLVKGPGMMYSPMMKEFGGVKIPTSKWAHFPNGNSAIGALDSMLTSGRSKIYKENMSLAEAMANYDPRLGNTAGKFSKYTIKDLKKDPKLKDEFLYHLIKNEVSAQDFNQYYAPAFTDRAVGPSTMNYQVTSRQYGSNVGKSLLKYKVSSENPKKTISAFEGPLANKINFNGEGTPLSSEFNLIIQNNDILEALLGMQGVNKAVAKGLSKHYLLDLLKVNNKHLINTAVQQAAQEAATYQNGGNVNLTGYTPGTETMANPMNEIPSGDITMEKTPIDLLAIGKGGAHHGFLEILKANSKEPNKYTKVKSTIEIPLEQQKQEVLMAKYGKLINNINRYNTGDMQFGGMINAIIEGNNAGLYGNYTPEQAAYLNQMSGGDPNSIEHYSRATPEFNARMLQGFNQQQVPQVAPQADVMVPTNRLFPQQAAYTQPLPGDAAGYNPNNQPQLFQDIVNNNSSIYTRKGDPYEYKRINGQWQTRKKRTEKWITVTDPTIANAINNSLTEAEKIGHLQDLTAPRNKNKTTAQTGKINGISNNYIPNPNTNYGYNSEIVKLFSEKGIPLNGENIDAYYKGALNVPSNNLNSNNNSETMQSLTTPFSEKGQQDAYTKYYANPNNRYNGPQFGPPVGTLSEDEQKEIRDWQIATLSMVPGGRLAVSGIVKGATYLPKVGKAVQYGANYIDEAGNIVSAAGSKLGKAPKAAIDATKQFFKVGSKPNMYDDILAGKVNAAGKYIDPITKRFTTAPVDTRGTLQRVFQDRTFSTSFKNTLNDVISTGRKLSQKAYKALTPAEKNAYDAIIKKGLDSPLYANPAYNPGAARAFHVVPKQYGGYIPKFQYGGSVNDQHAIPVFSSNLEDFGLTELQTEKDEIAYMPDGSLPDVKAKELHKHQDKNAVTDIMQSGTYIFSNDPKMKFSIKSKIGGVELGDMKLGRSVFKYVENEISEGPKDIMLKDMFFNGSKKELTTADIAKNIKKNLPLVDLKNDYFADRAIEENKDQRKEYIAILKAFNEYKKPKPRTIPKAQYGMQIQPTQNGLEGVMGYGMKQADPFYKMDNNIISMWNIPQPKLPPLPRMYEDGGSIPQAQLGKLLRYTVPGAYFVSEWIGNNKKKKQERENAVLSAEAQGYRDQLQDGVDRSGTIGVGTNLATYAASLNVPLQRYDDQSEQMAMYNAAANRAAQRLEATKYTTSQGIGGASSLARYSNPTNYGDYLSKVQSQSDSNIGRINQAIADLDMARANQNVGFVSARNAGRNQSLNARDTQLYNANVQGLGNVGRSAQEATFNSADTRYRMGNEKMAYDAYLKDKAQAAKDKVIQDWEGSLDALGQIGLTAATGGFGDLGGGSGKNNIIGSSGVTAAQQASNNAYMQNGMANSMNNFLQNRNNSFNPIQPLPPILNRNGVNNGNFMNRNTDNWNYNFFDLSTWR